jgi:parallel beta-helix repeat protein/predicted outer membrane repeat protein
MNIKLKIPFCLVLIGSIFQAQAWVSVGSSPGFGTCTFSSIQAAINSNENEIRIVNDSNFPQNFEENIIIDSSVDIKGGYNTCLAASLNQVGTSNSIIRGSASLGSPVVKITSTSSPTIRFYDLTLRDAIDTIFVTNGGQGIDIGSSNGLIEVIDSLIISNSAEDGGGIYIGATIGSLSLVITDSSIFGNSATTRGGGIFCADADTVIRISGNSLIGENSAEDGGGIAALNGCSVTMDSGSDLSTDLRGIVGNSATQFGGGVYLNLAASLTLQGNKYAFGILGNNTDPVTIANNTANSKGGGIYAINSSQIEIIDGLITNNMTSTSNGGGIFLGSSATTPVTLTMQAHNGSCWNSGKCSILSGNKGAGNGGGIYLEGAAQATILNTHIFGNRANFGTAVYVSAVNGLATATIIEGSYFYANGNNAANSYADNYVIRGNGDVDIDLVHNTFADNDINDSRAIIGVTGGSNLSIKNSLLDNHPETILQQTASTVQILCTIASDLSSLDFLVFPTSFIDSANQDYHLASDSQAIDACAMTATSLNFDTDNQPRGWDDDTMGNFNGTYDAGADETYANDVIFKNGFE